MSEEEIKETAVAYTVSATQLTIPPSWTWLAAFDLEVQTAFLQEILNITAEAQLSNDWNKLKMQITAWQEQAEAIKQHTLMMERGWDSLMQLVEDSKVETGIADLAHQHNHC